ncbi:MAG TPA: HAMP domain-containing sensor histidine kinase [Thermoanaerobaculaceae bacterium]|nr:HAMP domain-containing sensor histidine kinase [Thermoanaerobaculaceae bacterium]HRS15590.1 HAMP domain-containing sensor histidine kinase [Thermoanaerobaculaceae bacterium]
MLCAVGPTGKRALVAVVDLQVRAQVEAVLGPYFDAASLLAVQPPADLLEGVIAAAPDLAFVDADFPGFGVEALEQLRTRPELEGLYLVVLAAPARLAPLLEHSLYCADDLLLVPVQDIELAARVRMAVSRVLARYERRQQVRALEDLQQRQREFLSVVSHEIRTPLSAIMSSANILRRYGRERPDSVEKFSTVIQQEGKRLTRLINNLLDLAKIEAGEVEWRFVPTALAEVLSLVRDSFAALVGERHLELAVEPASAPETVELDRDKIIQVLVNLLSNAVKHSPEGSTVTLRCETREGGGVRFEVEDQGSGIPPGQEERIFERFQQLEVGDERTGTGLGLTISRHIVERHGGRIWATSAPGGGALFIVELPAAPPAGADNGPV